MFGQDIYACPQGPLQTRYVQRLNTLQMRLGGYPCQGVYCSLSRHWVTMALSATLFIAGGNVPTYADDRLC